jgi:Putative auto-transporter adhesin, head GIN domain
MKRLLSLALLTALAAGCVSIDTNRISGSGDVVTQPRAVGAFHRIALEGNAELRVTAGGAQKLAIRAQQNIADLIKTNVADGVLTVSTDKKYFTDHEVRVLVTVPSLDGLEVRGAASAQLDGIHGPKLDVTISGAGNVDATGKVDRLTLDCRGVGNAQLRNLVAKDVIVQLSGVGNAEVNATGTIDVTIAGVGSVSYSGSARVVHQAIRGFGSFRHE